MLLAVGWLTVTAVWMWAAKSDETVASPVKTETTAEQATPPPVASFRALPAERAPLKQPRVLTDRLDHRGNPVSVSCATCHATREPSFKAGREAVPTEFHPKLVYAHGGLSCLSCHNAADYDTLRLADGRALAYQATMDLCAQCHGPQTRDYQHGSHGGMVGHWDQTKGPRDRNRCTDCHDVHAPAYPTLMPVFPPRDRGALEQARRDAAHLIEHATSLPHD